MIGTQLHAASGFPKNVQPGACSPASADQVGSRQPFNRVQAKEQLSREPLALPTMKINPDVKDLFEFTFEDFTLEGYEAHPNIKAPIAV